MAEKTYVAWSAGQGFKVPQIIIRTEATDQSGIDWEALAKRPWSDNSEIRKMADAALYLAEGIEQMTGTRLKIRSSSDLQNGIVLVTLAAATEQIRSDVQVQEALAADTGDGYSQTEAWFIRSESSRLLVVANTIAGLVCAVPELLESVGYEVLAMGPSWVYVPGRFRKKLTFHICRSGRPSYYLRGLYPTSGQEYGQGTIIDPALLPAPAGAGNNVQTDPLCPQDETVDVSWRRWAIGRRLRTQSMPGFPGHALQVYHRRVLQHMRRTNQTSGFLATARIGLATERPAASAENEGWIWIDSPSMLPQPNDELTGLVHRSNGQEWSVANLLELGVNIDLSVPFVREIILRDFIESAELHFSRRPGEVFVFAAEPEDGDGYSRLGQLAAFPNWFPEYLQATGETFGAAYKLHGFQGISQEKEQWDSASPSDFVFGFCNWLLLEYDRWLKMRTQAEQQTEHGQLKRDRVRCSLYSYNYHDVPPGFNPDTRIRLMIASYPKHRGAGKWKYLATSFDVASAFRVMLPTEPSGDYWIVSLAYHWDRTTDGISPRCDAAPTAMIAQQREHFTAGFRALVAEVDFNFGAFGLYYYLLSHLLYNVELSATGLHRIRNRWLQKSFGTGWIKMRQYYDLMLKENFKVNAQGMWGTAIHLLDSADRLVDGTKEPHAKRRIDEMKQYWYFYFLVASKLDNPYSKEMREFLWKGQTSYIHASHMIARRVFLNADVGAALPEYCRTRAHFTTAETRDWWQKVLTLWPQPAVSYFHHCQLIDGTSVADTDVLDLVSVRQFQDASTAQPLHYNAFSQEPATFCTTAESRGDQIGFQLYWPVSADPLNRYYMARDVRYTIEYRDTHQRAWKPITGLHGWVQPTEEISTTAGTQRFHYCRVSMDAPYTGTYRIQAGYGGNLAFLTDLAADVRSGLLTRQAGFSCDCIFAGHTQNPVSFYIPRGTQSLDFEVWDAQGIPNANLHLHLMQRPAAVNMPGSLVPSEAMQSRSVAVNSTGTQVVPLQPGEDGTVGQFSMNGFAMPYLYSVPMLWAKSPIQLLVPRAVAVADGLDF